MRFWHALDAYLVYRAAWKKSSVQTNERRSARGLPPVPHQWVSYIRNYPNICFGGVSPFGEYKVPSNVKCVGALDVQDIISTANSKISEDLQKWLVDAATDEGVIYAGFGTGTT